MTMRSSEVTRPTGILGGSFNPPHFAHLRLAEAALDSGLVNKILFIPAAIPPHKVTPAEADAATRLAMTELLIQNDPRMEVDGIELTRSGPSYTIDTIRTLYGQYPGQRYRLLIGSDMARMFGKWRSYKELLELAPPLIAERPDARLENGGESVFPGLTPVEAEILWAGRFSMELINLNSTLIRRRIAEGANENELAGYMPRPVLDYILENGLYGLTKKARKA